ncbi:dTDP-glucose 4,6-dehydratase [Candidatus Nomurabacteria bacterium RIFCSPHIGHO2_02_FULL_36_29]|nr:MAG: dTDP-glucose 4,6-dehydratase [Candidatus Nomurabacteria bacterium RIFCSPHIGHO2_02_FULL_36_29]
MKILVTGGAGFIGSNFIRHMLNKHKDCSIVNLDKLTYAGNLKNLSDLSEKKNYSFVKGDICDKKVVEKAMGGCGIVINFAAETHVDRSIIEAGSFIKTDVYGTYVLLQAVMKNKIKRFIQISTDEVYGSIENGSFSEDDPLNPRNPYSASKAGADKLVLSFFSTYNTPVILTRSSNNFGPYQHPEKFIPLFVTNLLENKKVPLYGDGKNIRDWVYVLDNCEAIDLVMHKGKDGEIYNIAGNNEKKNIEVVKLILKKLNKNESFIEYVTDRLGHDRRYSINCEKIKKLGWEQKHDFDDSLNLTIDWYKSNISWWKEIKAGM